MSKKSNNIKNQDIGVKSSSNLPIIIWGGVGVVIVGLTIGAIIGISASMNKKAVKPESSPAAIAPVAPKTPSKDLEPGASAPTPEGGEALDTPPTAPTTPDSELGSTSPTHSSPTRTPGTSGVAPDLSTTPPSLESSKGEASGGGGSSTPPITQDLDPVKPVTSPSNPISGTVGADLDLPEVPPAPVPDAPLIYSINVDDDVLNSIWEQLYYDEKDYREAIENDLLDLDIDLRPDSLVVSVDGVVITTATTALGQLSVDDRTGYNREDALSAIMDRIDQALMAHSARARGGPTLPVRPGSEIVILTPQEKLRASMIYRFFWDDSTPLAGFIERSIGSNEILLKVVNLSGFKNLVFQVTSSEESFIVELIRDNWFSDDVLGGVGGDEETVTLWIQRQLVSLIEQQQSADQPPLADQPEASARSKKADSEAVDLVEESFFERFTTTFIDTELIDFDPNHGAGMRRPQQGVGVVFSVAGVSMSVFSPNAADAEIVVNVFGLESQRFGGETKINSALDYIKERVDAANKSVPRNTPLDNAELVGFIKERARTRFEFETEDDSGIRIFHAPMVETDEEEMTATLTFTHFLTETETRATVLEFQFEEIEGELEVKQIRDEERDIDFLSTPTRTRVGHIEGAKYAGISGSVRPFLDFDDRREFEVIKYVIDLYFDEMVYDLETPEPDTPESDDREPQTRETTQRQNAVQRLQAIYRHYSLNRKVSLRWLSRVAAGGHAAHAGIEMTVVGTNKIILIMTNTEFWSLQINVVIDRMYRDFMNNSASGVPEAIEFLDTEIQEALLKKNKQ